MEQPQVNNNNETNEQVIFGSTDGRTQPWRQHWQPGPKGDREDKLKGFSKGQQIALGGTSGNDGESERVLYDSKSETL